VLVVTFVASDRWLRISALVIALSNNFSCPVAAICNDFCNALVSCIRFRGLRSFIWVSWTTALKSSSAIFCIFRYWMFRGRISNNGLLWASRSLLVAECGGYYNFLLFHYWIKVIEQRKTRKEQAIWSIGLSRPTLTESAARRVPERRNSSLRTRRIKRHFLLGPLSSIS